MPKVIQGSLTIIGCLLCTFSNAQSGQVLRIKSSNCAYNSKGTTTNFASGFVYKENGRVVGIMTALHAVCGCATISAEDNTGKDFFSLKISQADIDNDIALLTSNEILSNFNTGLEFSNVNNASLANKRVSMFAYPYGVELNIDTKDARVRETPTAVLKKFVKADVENSLRERGSPNINNDVLNLQLEITPGCSGAPILYDSKVIGVANGGLDEGRTHVCWAIPTQNIQLLPTSRLEPRFSNLGKRNPNSLFILTCDVDGNEKPKVDGISQPFSMVDSEISAETSDANSNNPEVIITSIDGRGGGYRIEHRYPSNRENGQIYFKKVFKLNSNFSSFMFDIGKGEISSYDRETTKRLTMSRLIYRHPNVLPEEWEKVSKMNFICKMYLGEKYGPAKAIFETESPIIKYTTTDSEQNNNPRTIYPPKDNVISLNGEKNITCVCRYNDARKDDYHIINVPYSRIILFR